MPPLMDNLHISNHQGQSWAASVDWIQGITVAFKQFISSFLLDTTRQTFQCPASSSESNIDGKRVQIKNKPPPPKGGRSQGWKWYPVTSALIKGNITYVCMHIYIYIYMYISAICRHIKGIKCITLHTLQLTDKDFHLSHQALRISVQIQKASL